MQSVKLIFKILTICLFILSSNITRAQNGINFQGVARTANNIVLASQNISIRLSILNGSINGSIEYQETKIVSTNAQGLFNIVIGDGTSNNTLGNYATIDWKQIPKFLKMEIDQNGGNNFTIIGTTQLQSVAYANFANGVSAENIVGLVPVARGGTGASNLQDFKQTLQFNNINNTSDLNKPISIATQTALNAKLNVSDTLSLSTRMNNKLNLADSLIIYVTPTQLSASRTTMDTSYIYQSLGTKAALSNPQFLSDIKVNGLTLGRGNGNVLSNIALGEFALNSDSAKAGDNNIGIGTQTLRYNNGGIKNVALGNSALYSNGNSSRMTAIGVEADVINPGLNLSNSTALGFGAKVNESNLIQLGNADIQKVKTNGVITAAGFKTPTGTGNEVLLANGTTLNTSIVEVNSNKSIATDLGGANPSDILYPTQKAVKAYVTANSSSGGIADGGITTIKLADGAVTDTKVTSISISKVSSATTAFIAPSSNRNYVTDAQVGVISNTSGTNTGDETTSTIKSKLGISILSGSNTGDQTINLTGDVTGAGTGIFTTTLANSGVSTGTYGSSTAIPVLTVDAKGRVTSASTVGVIAGVNTLTYTTSTAYANGGTVSGTTLTLSSADGSNPGLISTGAQTIAGTKTFSNDVTAPTFIGALNGNATTATTAGNITEISNTTLTSLTNLNTVGTITSGTWSGSVIGSNVGGAGAVNGLLKANGSGIVSAADVNDIPNLSSMYIQTNDGYQPAQNTNIFLTGTGNFGSDIIVSGHNLGIGLNDRIFEHNNLAFGKYALFLNDRGFGNTSIGAYSSLTHYGDNNTALGVYANSGIPENGNEYNNYQFGENNTAIGAYALTHKNNPQIDLFHSSNTAIGAYSLSNIFNGYSNISIGVNAGKNVTNGFKNILIGDSAGNNTTNQYSNAIALGVKAPLKGSNTIQLGSDGSNGGNAITHIYTSGKLVSGNVTYPNIAGVNGQFLTINNGLISFTDLNLENLIKNSTTLSSPQNASISISGNLTTLQDANINGIKFGLGGGSISSNNVIGYNALSSNSTGSNNIAFGYNSLKSNTTGIGNIGIGFNSLYTNTNGSDNISIGVGSQYFNNGQRNISLGSKALYSNSSGSENTAIGFATLYSNSGGSDNIALGPYNLYLNTTGYKNISIGMYNLFNNINGYSNIAFGESSLQRNSSGNNNISFGEVSMNFNSSGSQNIAIGKNALGSNTTGNNNIAIGENSMTGNTTGSYNIALNGNASGSYNIALNGTAAGSYNTAIGSSSYVQGGTNSTALGNGATTYGENNTIVLGNADIIQVRTNGKMKLGPVLYPNFGASSGTVLKMGNNNEAYWANLPSYDNEITTLTNSIIANTSNINSNTTSITSLINGVNSNTTSITSLINGVNSNTTSITSLINNSVPYSGANRPVDLGNFDLKVNGISVGAGNNSSRNTLVGKSALNNTTTGYDNTAIGFRTLNSNTSGYTNVAIGSWSLESNTTGISNIAIGSNALSSNINGNANIGIGSLSLFSNTGDDNIAIGDKALSLNSSGSNNIAIGDQNLTFNTTGSYNIAIGGKTNNTTGSYNVFIGGNGSGINSNYNTVIGGGSIILGDYTNTTAIGSGIIANQSNSVFLGNTDVRYVYSSGSFSSSSDRRLKKEIVKVPYGLNTVLKLNPVKFRYIKNNQVQIGFIAQELKTLIPELVNGKEGDIDKGEILSVSYANMVAVLTKALQEEDQKVKNLEKELIDLKNELILIRNIFKKKKNNLKDSNY